MFLLVVGALLWSGSVDSTLRVWDLASGKCLATLAAANGGPGHTQAVTCLEFVPNTGAEPFIASGAADNAVKLWSTTGSLLHTVTHGAMVTSLKAFKDTLGGKFWLFYVMNAYFPSQGFILFLIFSF